MQLNVYSIENETLCYIFAEFRNYPKLNIPPNSKSKLKYLRWLIRSSDGFLRPNQLKQKITRKCTFKILHLSSYVEYKFQDNISILLNI
jgi:hypothetical protein